MIKIILFLDLNLLNMEKSTWFLVLVWQAAPQVQESSFINHQNTKKVIKRQSDFDCQTTSGEVWLLKICLVLNLSHVKAAHVDYVCNCKECIGFIGYYRMGSRWFLCCYWIYISAFYSFSSTREFVSLVVLNSVFLSYNLGKQE